MYRKQRVIVASWQQQCYYDNIIGNHNNRIRYYITYERPEDIDALDEAIKKAIQKHLEQAMIEGLSVHLRCSYMLVEGWEDKHRANQSVNAYGRDHNYIKLINQETDRVKKLHTRIFTTDLDTVLEQIKVILPPHTTINIDEKFFDTIVEQPFMNLDRAKEILNI